MDLDAMPKLQPLDAKFYNLLSFIAHLLHVFVYYYYDERKYHYFRSDYLSENVSSVKILVIHLTLLCLLAYRTGARRGEY